MKGIELSNISICRFRFPTFPLDETKLITGMSKEIDDDLMKTYKADLIKILKYLVRQTHTENKQMENESWEKMKRLRFWEFLYEVGMFDDTKRFDQIGDQDKENAKLRYLHAISAVIQ